jgi:hypothetical protein
MQEFIQKAGYGEPDPDYPQYYDGMVLAKRLGIKLETPVPPIRKVRKFGGEYLKRIIGK